jgi:hypothetical protein
LGAVGALRVFAFLTELLTGTGRDRPTERVLFALVANRALDSASKLAAAAWVSRRVHIDGLPETSDDACYRAVDWPDQRPELLPQAFDDLLVMHK